MSETKEWDLSEIEPKNTTESINKIIKLVSSFEKSKPKLNNNTSFKTFFQLLKEFEDIKKEMSKISSYVGLRFTENTANSKYLAMQSEIDSALTNLGNKLMFFNLWFKDLPENKAKELTDKLPEEYKNFAILIRKNKQYFLKENEEKIINIKNMSGTTALNNIYDILTSQFEFKIKNKKVDMQTILKMIRSADTNKREQAYTSLLSKYKENRNVISEIYKSIVIDWSAEGIDLRKYKDPISIRNSNNDIPNKAVESLIRVCNRNLHLFHEYFEIKRKALGLKKFKRFDIYAPLKENKAKIPYDKAIKLTLESFEEFSPKFKSEAEAIIKADHIHSKVQKNKRHGAFCASVNAKIKPYILLSYSGTMLDVSTLAHELGHGVHHTLAQNQSEFTFHSSLPLAETASIFSEMLLSEKIARQYPKEARSLKFEEMQDFYASIIRQIKFVEFEMLAHKMIKEGKTTEDISKEYLKNVKSQVGPKVEVSDLFAYEWCYIPHIFHSPFYCYAYSFGNLLTLALYEMYRQKGKEFVPKFLNLLSSGSSKSPVELTKALGIDICSDNFWEMGFKVIKDTLNKIK